MFTSKIRDAVRQGNSIQLAGMAAMLFIASSFVPGTVANADIGATHTGLISEFASFNTPGVVDGRVEAIAIDGDTVYVGGNFTQIQEPLGGEIIDQPHLFAYSKSTGNIIRTFDPILDKRVLALEVTGDGTGVFAAGTFGIVNGEGGRRGLAKIGAYRASINIKCCKVYTNRKLGSPRCKHRRC